MRIAGATGGVGPAFWALFVEAQVESAIRRGMPPELGLVDRRRDDGELGRAAALTRIRHARAAARGRLARRDHRPRPGRAGTWWRARGAGAGDGRRGGLRVTVLGSVRSEIADFVGTFVTVYVLVIIAWVVLSFIFSMGVRLPYTRWSTEINAAFLWRNTT